MREEQRAAALAKANVIRRERKEMRLAIARGERDPVSVLKDPPESCEGLAVHKFLTWLPRWGRTRALRALRAAQVAETNVLGQLTDRARSALAERVA